MNNPWDHSQRKQRASASLLVLAAALVGALSFLGFLVIRGGATDRDDERMVAAYIFLNVDRWVADRYVDPLVGCDGYQKCTPGGMIYGLYGVGVGRVYDGGWALELEFNRRVPDSALEDLMSELVRRAEELGLGPLIFLTGDDHWPTCSGSPVCPTVNERAG
jgi:hypothetical protein